jgi:transposase InsO family protein
MDYIVELPKSEGYNAIYVCVDRLTKMAHFIPTTTTVTAEQTAQLFYRYVFKDHGLPRDIVSDRGPQFVSQFMRHLLEKLGIQGNRSTSHHPQSDGQTERVNQTLEQYLRVYCDYQQDNWYELLPLAEFVYNNTQNASTRMSPFFANKGHHPRCHINVAAESANPAVETLANRLRTAHHQLRTNLQHARERYKAQYDRHTLPAPSYNPGDKVWLLRRNIRTSRPSQKLDVKKMGPFPIREVVGEAKLAYRLELPPQMRIHDVFHVSLLEPYRENQLEGRVQEAPLPEIVEGEEEWEVKEVVDSKVSRGRLLYLVDWEGFNPEDRTWEPVEHVSRAADAIAEFHRRYPHRPSPQDVPARGQRSNRRQRQ